MSKVATEGIQTLDGTKELSTERIVQGSAKAWARFLPNSGGVLEGSFNFSSTVDNGVGDFTLAYTNAFASNENAPVGTAGLDSTAPGEVFNVGNAEGDLSGQTATSFRAQIYDGSLRDTNPCFCHVMGDLA